jgi:hypothetical protein
MTPEQQEIQSLKKQLWRDKRDNEILKKGNSLVRYGQSVSNMISKLSKACQQYNTKEPCDLFDHSRSSYYYQSRNKTVSESTKAIIKSMKKMIGYTYGRRRLQRQLVSKAL